MRCGCVTLHIVLALHPTALDIPSGNHSFCLMIKKDGDKTEGSRKTRESWTAKQTQAKFFWGSTRPLSLGYATLKQAEECSIFNEIQRKGRSKRCLSLQAVNHPDTKKTGFIPCTELEFSELSLTNLLLVQVGSKN